MDRFRGTRRLQVGIPETLNGGSAGSEEEVLSNTKVVEDASGGSENSGRSKNGRVDPEPFMGMKVRRRGSLRQDCNGDYLDVPSDPYLMKILSKQGDHKILFADRVLKFTGTGKMKRRILLITDFAIYLVDPDSDVLKRRIALAAVDKLCLSKLSDNFFAIIIPSEYDCLMASTRKTEIVTVLVGTTKRTSEYELEVVFSNRFEYHAAADLVKEIEFEEVDGMFTNHMHYFQPVVIGRRNQNKDFTEGN